MLTGKLNRYIVYFFLILAIYSCYKGYKWLDSSSTNLYKIALDPSWEPLTFYGKEVNVTTFSIDLLFAIARDEKIQVEVIKATRSRLLELLDEGKVTAILTPLLPNGRNEDIYLFSEPYLKFGAVLVVKKGFKIESIEKLPKQRIAVMRGSPILFHLTLDPTVIVIPYESPIMALDELAKGGVDAVLMDQLLSFLYFGELYKDRLQVATLPLTKDGLRLVTLKDKEGEDLIDAFNRGLKSVRGSGLYKELLTRWELFDPEEIKN